MTDFPSGRDHDTDFQAIMQDNLDRVFNERDAGARGAAIRDLYVDGAVLYQPDNVVTGLDAISAAVEDLHGTFADDFRFVTTLAGLGHHDMGRLRWEGRSPGGPVLVTGTDVATLVDGRISTLHIFLDPQTKAKT